MEVFFSYSDFTPFLELSSDSDSESEDENTSNVVEDSKVTKILFYFCNTKFEWLPKTIFLKFYSTGNPFTLGATSLMVWHKTSPIFKF